MNGIRNWFFNLKMYLTVLFNSWFRGLKAADDKAMGVTKDGKATDNAVEEQVQEQGVLNDLLRGEVTQEVMELRDSNYRIFRHADDYSYLGNGNVVKKVKNMLQQDLNVYNPENHKVILIQDNKLVVKGIVESAESYNLDKDGDVVQDNKKEAYTIKIEREVFPRFLIEKYIKKIVVRESDEEYKLFVDLYCSSYARQFNPTDSLFINELMNIYGKKVRNFDTVDITSIEFVTDKAYGADDITLYRFEDTEYQYMHMYDKDFVITYKVHPVCNGVDLTAQYKTKEMDEKYATKAVKNPELALSFENYVGKKMEDTLNTEEALSLIKNLNLNDEKPTE